MPRKARQESKTGVYHVMTRGLNKIAVFDEKREKTRIINLIRENLFKFDVVIYAYCIMPNHLHLLIKADIKELASFMAKVLAAYAQYYNYKHNRIGYVFQNRFKSQCVEDESYFWTCFRYIHMNPCKKMEIERLLKYEYCSFKEFYFDQKDLIHESAFAIEQTRFATKKEFAEFHKKSSRAVLIDVPEDIAWNNLQIAKEILGEMQKYTGFAQEEILEYSDTRKLFEKVLIQVLKTSKERVKLIEGELRRELIQVDG